MSLYHSKPFWTLLMSSSLNTRTITLTTPPCSPISVQSWTFMLVFFFGWGMNLYMNLYHEFPVIPLSPLYLPKKGWRVRTPTGRLPILPTYYGPSGVWGNWVYGRKTFANSVSRKPRTLPIYTTQFNRVRCHGCNKPLCDQIYDDPSNTVRPFLGLIISRNTFTSIKS